MKRIRPTIESLKLRKQYKNGDKTLMDYRNNVAQRHGFKDMKDVRDKIKKEVMSMIQLKQDHGIINESVYTILKTLPPELFKTKLQCVCCGESYEEFLSLEHSDNSGAKHRKEYGLHSGSPTFRHLIKKGFVASDYKILCYNCNLSMGFNGFCPHQRRTNRNIQEQIT